MGSEASGLSQIHTTKTGMSGTKKVLVIDDDHLVLRSIAVALKRQGYEYSLASSAREALVLAEARRFDVILADIRMPEQSGVDAVKEIQQKRKAAGFPEYPVVFITGYAEDAAYLKAGAFGEIVQKPFDLNQLMITMREYL